MNIGLSVHGREMAINLDEFHLPSGRSNLPLSSRFPVDPEWHFNPYVLRDARIVRDAVSAEEQAVVLPMMEKR